MPSSPIPPGTYDACGAAAAHAAADNPHPGVYQPLDADLTSLAAADKTGVMYYRSADGVWSPVAVGSNLTFTSGTLAASGGGATIGATVSGGTANRSLFVGTGGVLAEDSGSTTLVTGPRTVVGTHIVRQTGGTAGTHEVQVSHNGTRTLIESKTGGIVLTPSFGQTVTITESGGGGLLCSVCDTTSSHRSNGGLGCGSTAVITWGSGDMYSARNTGLARAASAVVGITNGSSGGGTLSSVPLTPAQITADQSAYAFGGAVARFYRLTADAARTIHGAAMPSAVNGQEWETWNTSGQIITVANDSASAAAVTNRILTDTGADLVMTPGRIVFWRWDGTISRYRVR